MHRDRNLCNILNQKLYQNLYLGTKQLIESFMEEIGKCLHMIEISNSIPLTSKLEFFIESRHTIGRTAFVLSGGGCLGMYHFGVIKVIADYNLIPYVVSGSSAGSIVASFLGCLPREKLIRISNQKGEINWTAFQQRDQRFFKSMYRKLNRFFTKGVLLDIQVVKDYIRDNVGDMTFQEAYDKTGIILNITVTENTPNHNGRALNYITAPNIIIWSAVGCSCSVPMIYGSTNLMCKNEFNQIEPFSNLKFIDGSIFSDIPIRQLKETFNVTNVIVSQVNPFVVPFQDRADQREGSQNQYIFYKLLDVCKNLVINEVKHRVNCLSEFGILPFGLQQLTQLFNQDYQGNVTIVPKTNFMDYVRVLSLPQSDEDLDYYQGNGVRSAFKKIFYIQMTMKYEMLLDQSYTNLIAEFKKQLKRNLKISYSSIDRVDKGFSEDSIDDFNLNNQLDELGEIQEIQTLLN